MSILSTKGPETFDRYRLIWPGVQLHLRESLPKYPHGQGFGPPPTRAGPLAEWCGIRTGRVPNRALFFPKSPTDEYTWVVSNDCSRVKGGRIVASLCESIVFPAPGGPII